jgi:hypothetical protein
MKIDREALKVLNETVQQNTGNVTEQKKDELLAAVAYRLSQLIHGADDDKACGYYIPRNTERNLRELDFLAHQINSVYTRDSETE